MEPLIATLTIALACSPSPLYGVTLRPDTSKGWKEYVRHADAGMEPRRDGRQPFLWIYEEPDRAVRLRRGEILIQPAAGNGVIQKPGGLIHHWIGAAFIPQATVGMLLSVLHDYEHYKEFYRPFVTDSKQIGISEVTQQFSMTCRERVLFVTAAISGQYESRDYPLSLERGYNITDSIRIQQIDNYGQAGERLVPAGTGNGFTWRLHSIARYQQRDGGVYLELEGMALTRDIPSPLRWLVVPLIRRLSINSVMICLRPTRDAVTSEALKVQTL